jgi:hypothetical protein
VYKWNSYCVSADCESGQWLLIMVMMFAVQMNIKAYCGFHDISEILVDRNVLTHFLLSWVISVVYYNNTRQGKN